MIKLFLFLFISEIIFSQDTAVSKYDFIELNKNYIVFNHEPKFYKKLSSSSKIRILHIGDSHLASGDISKGFILTLRNRYLIHDARLFFEENRKVVIKKGRRKKVFYKKVSKTVTIPFEKDSIGIEYFGIALSGKTFEYFSSLNELDNVINEFKPDLTIISLGTNDKVANYSENDLNFYISSLVEKFHKINSEIVLVTPIEIIKKRQKTNNSEVINKVIKQIVEDKKIALYDLYEVAGGKNSRNYWLKNGLSSRDMIHFSHQGYFLQGVLMAKAIINSHERN